MDRQTIEDIIADRLGGWALHLVDHHATPALLIGIGHDHMSGDLQLCVTENTPMVVVRAWLAWAIEAIDRGAYVEKHGDGSPQSDSGAQNGPGEAND